MIIITTPQIEGKGIREYKGIVFGEVVSGVDWEMEQRAAALGSNAVVGVEVD